MFNNQIFDGWLDKKAEEILSKVNREAITTEEMIVLILKAQTNHFYHMDQEAKQDMNNLRGDMSNLRGEMKEFKTELTQDMNSLRSEMKEFKTEIRQDLKEESKKQDTRFMWSTGITVTMFFGLYLKLFLG